MEMLNWVIIGSDSLTVISFAAPAIVLVYCLWAKRRSSVTLAMARCGMLLFVAAVTHLLDVLPYWRSVSWPIGIMKTLCAGASVGLSYTLLRVIRRAVEFRDLEQLAAAATDLRRSRERFEHAVVGSSSGFWEWYVEANEVWFSARFRELLG